MIGITGFFVLLLTLLPFCLGSNLRRRRRSLQEQLRPERVQVSCDAETYFLVNQHQNQRFELTNKFNSGSSEGTTQPFLDFVRQTYTDDVTIFYPSTGVFSPRSSYVTALLESKDQQETASTRIRLNGIRIECDEGITTTLNAIVTTTIFYQENDRIEIGESIVSYVKDDNGKLLVEAIIDSPAECVAGC